MKRLNNSWNKFSGGSFAKILAVIMCVSMLFGVVMTSAGCNLINNITEGIKATSNSLSETELARLITNAVISDKNVGDSYAKIPKSQLNGLSYSMFSEYCSILRKCSNEHGTVDSFRILNENDKNAYFTQINSIDGDYLIDINAYGDLDVVELNYVEDKAPGSAPVRFVIAKSGNKYAMASKYITDSLLAYSYINH